MLLEQRDEDIRARREANRKKRKGKDKDNIDEDEFKNVGPQNEQEMAFEQKVAENMAEQDQMLAEIGAGLDELKELATEANKHLVVQQAMLEQGKKHTHFTFTFTHSHTHTHTNTIHTSHFFHCFFV